MYSKINNIVLAFHGCDKNVCNKVVNGGSLQPSTNDYDWLGHGIYFWENDPQRAMEFARDAVQNTKQSKGTIKKPAVIGAVIDLGYCLNLTDYYSTQVLQTGYEYLVKEKSSKPFYLLNLKTGEISDYEKSKEYVWNYSYVDGLALVLEMNAKNADYSIVDKKGNVVLQNIEQANFYYSEGMLAVQMSDGSSGFVDKTGKFVIKTSFYRNLEDEGPRKSPSIQYFFNEGLAIVQSEKDVWEIFDTNGNLFIPGLNEEGNKIILKRYGKTFNSFKPSLYNFDKSKSNQKYSMPKKSKLSASSSLMRQSSMRKSASLFGE